MLRTMHRHKESAKAPSIITEWIKPRCLSNTAGLLIQAKRQEEQRWKFELMNNEQCEARFLR